MVPDRRARRLVGADRCLRLPVQDDVDPEPERGLPDPVVVRLLRRRQVAGRPVRHAEPAEHLLLGDEAEPAQRGGRRRGPVVLDQPRHRPQGDHPGRVQRRSRRCDAGRLHHHPAVREDPLPDPGTLPESQGPRGDPVAEAAAAAEQGGDPARVPQHHLLRPWGVRRAGRGAGLLREGREGPRPPGVRRHRQRAEQPLGVRPGQRPRGEEGAALPLPLRPPGHGVDEHDHGRRGHPGREAAAEVPGVPAVEPVRRHEGPHPHPGAPGAATSSASPTTRSTAVASGSPPP